MNNMIPAAERPIEKLIEVARRERPASLVIKNAKIYNVFTGETTLGDLAIEDGYIAGQGHYEGIEVIEAEGGLLVPGFIDSHVHIESSMTSPAGFARAVVAVGTTTVIADPHEIANVAGLAGLDYFLSATNDLPVNVYFMLPSCVPATPLEMGGAELLAENLAPYLTHPRILGLGEMMNYPGVLGRNPQVMDKLRLPCSLIDGHSPGLTGSDLIAYAAAGISTDHECIRPEEALERLALGISVIIREGTATRNLIDLWPAVTRHNAHLFLLGTDDRHAQDLVEQGSINYLVSLAQSQGGFLPDILNMATINSARHYGLSHTGALAPGYRADLALYHDLKSWKPSLVWKDGRLAAENGTCLWPETQVDDRTVRNTVHLAPLSANHLQIRASGPRVRVIGLCPGQIVTRHLIREPRAVNGFYEASPAEDRVKLAVWDRYRPNPPALSFLEGLGLTRGAIASTVSHDSHNLIVAGANDQDMLLAAAEAERLEGGLVMVLDGHILASLALPLGGLMSDLPLNETRAKLSELLTLGTELGLAASSDPFMSLAFMSLPVIPSLKLTAAGLVDVDEFKVVPLVF